MLNLSMLRRIAALFFIFVLAGHVWAGVCGCLGGGPSGGKSVSCCKKKKMKSAAVKAKNCCAAMCSARSGSRTPAAPAEAGVKISAPVLAAVEKLIGSLGWQPSPARRQMLAPPVRQSRAAPLFAPPDLYLQNHAFLI